MHGNREHNRTNNNNCDACPENTSAVRSMMAMTWRMHDDFNHKNGEYRRNLHLKSLALALPLLSPREDMLDMVARIRIDDD